MKQHLIPIFDGPSNWLEWSKAVRHYCILNDTLQYLENDPPLDQDKSATLAWSKESQKLLSLMLIRCAVAHQHKLEKHATAKAAWSAMNKIYDPVTTGVRLNLQREVSDLQMRENEPPADYCSRISFIISRMRHAEMNIVENDIVVSALGGLTPMYQPMVHMFCATNNSAMDLDDFEVALTDFHSKLKAVTKVKTEPVAFNAVLPTTSARHESSVCSHCGRTGHTPAGCWTLHPELRPKRQQKQKGKGGKIDKKPADLAAAAHLVFPAVALSLSDLQHPNIWALDTGSQPHVSGHKELFESITPICHEVVGVSGLTTVQGIGDIVLRVQEKGKLSVLTLKNVMYIPGTKVNLMSYGKLRSTSGVALMPVEEGIAVQQKGVHLFTAVETDDLFLIKTCPSLTSSTPPPVLSMALATPAAACAVQAASEAAQADRPPAAACAAQAASEAARADRTPAAACAGISAAQAASEAARADRLPAAACAVESAAQAASEAAQADRTPATGQDRHSTFSRQKLVMLTGVQNLWHARFGHMSHKNMQRLIREELATGIPGAALTSARAARAEPCDPCDAGKQHRVSHPESPEKLWSTQPMELVHMDLMGPFNVPGQLKYILCILDDHSRLSVVVPTATKQEATAQAIVQLKLLSTQSGLPVKRIRTDNGTEFCNQTMQAYTDANGILHEHSAPYTPEQNGRAERLNRTLLEKARALTTQAQLDKRWWYEAVRTASYLRNRSPGSNMSATPYQLFTGKVPDVSHLRVYGCRVSVKLSDRERAWKLSPLATPGIFLGYGTAANTYKVFIPSLNKTVWSPNVRFYETEFLPDLVKNHEASRQEEWAVPAPAAQAAAPVPAPAAQAAAFSPAGPASAPADPAPGAAMDPASASEEEEFHDVSDEEPDHDPLPAYLPVPMILSTSPAPAQADPTRAIRRSSRVRSAPVRYGSSTPVPAPAPVPASAPVPAKAVEVADSSTMATAQASVIPTNHPTAPSLPLPDISGMEEFVEVADMGTTAALLTAIDGKNSKGIQVPKSYKEAMNSPQKDEWMLAMAEEMTAIRSNGTYEQCRAPKGAKPIPVMWLYSLKAAADGSVQRFKARLVVVGSRQEEGTDYGEVFAPTSKHSTLRMLLAQVAKHDLELEQLDVKTAFLNGVLEEEVYVLPAPGYTDEPGMVWKLKRSLYGLKQAPRVWHQTLELELEKLGFSATEADPSFYVGTVEGRKVYLLVYVDDMLVAAKTVRATVAVKVLVANLFDIRDLGPAAQFLGMVITRDRKNRTVTLSSAAYAAEILERFGMQDCRPRFTPIDKGVVLLPAKDSNDLLDTKRYPYAAVIGSLLYLSACTRPDLTCAVNYLARYMAKPTKVAWDAAMSVLRYLKRTERVELLFGKDSAVGLVGYCDADHATDVATRRSTTGYVFLLDGGAVSWASKLQVTVAVSTAEAEYMACSNAVKEALWLRRLISVFEPVDGPVQLRTDNQAALSLTKNPVMSAKSKHIDVQMHFAREHVLRGNVEFTYLPTAEMPADFLTKSVEKDKHRFCAVSVGLTPM